MTILLKRNANPDPCFSVHGDYIEKGDIVYLDKIKNNFLRSVMFPTEILIKRKNKDDSYIYTASLICFDYVKQ